MNFPCKFEFFGSTVYCHFVFETLAFIIGIRVYYFLRKRISDSISDMNRLWILTGAMIGALVGSRLIAFFEVPTAIASATFLTFYQNKTIAGGFIGGLFGVELIKKLIGEKKASGDVYVIPILIAIFIGRIGCFSMGIAEPVYGLETTFFTGMNLGDGKLRHPVALYEMVYAALMMLVFYRFRKKKMLNGDRFKLFMVSYFLYRFGVEFIKPYHALFLGLSIIHWCALFMFCYYYRFIKRFFYA